MVSLRYDLRLPDWAPHDRAALYETALEQMRWADRLGPAAISFSEHHDTDDGYLPSPLPLAGAAAATTSQAMILIAAIPAPFYDPLRLAEDLIVLDHTSRGRVDVVVGGGYVPDEFARHGLDLDQRAAAMEEVVHVLRSAWTGEPFTYRGRTVRVRPAGYRDAPTIFMGGSSPAAARRAARLADVFIPENPDLWAPYREACLELGRPDPGPGREPGPRFLWVAEDPETEWDRIGPYLLHEMNAYGRLAKEAGRDTGYWEVDSLEELRDSGQYEIITPDECVQRTRATGMLGLHPLCGGMTPELSWRMLDLVERAVLPALEE